MISFMIYYGYNHKRFMKLCYESKINLCEFVVKLYFNLINTYKMTVWTGKIW